MYNSLLSAVLLAPPTLLSMVCSGDELWAYVASHIWNLGDEKPDVFILLHCFYRLYMWTYKIVISVVLHSLTWSYNTAMLKQTQGLRHILKRTYISCFKSHIFSNLKFMRKNYFIYLQTTKRNWAASCQAHDTSYDGADITRWEWCGSCQPDNTMKHGKEFHIALLELTGDSVSILCVLSPLNLETEINSRSVLRVEYENYNKKNSHWLVLMTFVCWCRHEVLVHETDHCGLVWRLLCSSDNPSDNKGQSHTSKHIFSTFRWS